MPEAPTITPSKGSSCTASERQARRFRAQRKVSYGAGIVRAKRAPAGGSQASASPTRSLFTARSIRPPGRPPAALAERDVPGDRRRRLQADRHAQPHSTDHRRAPPRADGSASGGRVLLALIALKHGKIIQIPPRTGRLGRDFRGRSLGFPAPTTLPRPINLVVRPGRFPTFSGSAALILGVPESGTWLGRNRYERD
jgi:hypothetical protein